MKWYFLMFALLFGFANVANAEIVVIGSKNMPDLSKSQVKSLFLGKLNKVEGVDHVQVLYLDKCDPTRKTFNKKILKKRENQLKSYWTKMMFTGEAKMPESVPNSADMVASVAKSNDTIGYADAASLNDTVKVLYKFD